MVALEFKQPVEVTTSKGDGYIWYLLDYGPHSDTLYTIILKETGECWQICHKDFRVKPNVSLGIQANFQKNGFYAETPLNGKPLGRNSTT